MATSTTEISAERRLAELAEEVLRLRKEREATIKPGTLDEGTKPVEIAVRGTDRGGPEDAAQEPALAPLVDKIAFGFARSLVAALKELENHIAAETRKVSDTVGLRLDALQASFQELSGAVSEQRSIGIAVQEKCEALGEAVASLQQCDAQREAEITGLREEAKEFSASVSERIEATTASLQEISDRQHTEAASLRDENARAAAELLGKIEAVAAASQEGDAKQEAKLSVLESETKEFACSASERLENLSKEVAVQQDDIVAMKSTICGFSSTVDGVVERLDRQAEAFRSMCSNYAQRESELEHLVEGLARLRTFPASANTNGL
jgi:chromosome segregation ATPase